MKLRKKSIKLLFFVNLILSAWIIDSTILGLSTVQASEQFLARQIKQKPSKIKRFKPRPIPPGIGTVLTGRSNGAGSQGPCSGADDIPLISIIPTEKVGDKNYVWSPTRRANPSLIFYLSYPKSTEIKFSVQDDRGSTIYSQTALKTSVQPGLISLNLPKILAPNRAYRWTLGIQCETGQDDYDDFVEGGIYRVSEPEEAISSISSLDQIWLDAEKGLWLDSLAGLTYLRNSNLNSAEVISSWKELLSQANIIDINFNNIQSIDP